MKKKILATIVIFSSSCQTLMADVVVPNDPAMIPYAHLLLNPHDVWLKETWTDDNSSYSQIRQSLEALDGKHIITEKLMDTYRLAYYEHKDDPTEAFRWGYAAYLTQASHITYSKQDIAPYLILDRFPKKSPRTYDYVRLKFLLSVEGTFKPKYKEIAARLYKEDPNDDKVTSSYASILSRTHEKTDMDKALSLAQKLISKEPSYAGHLTLLGSIYINAWWVDHTPKHGKQAIQAYRAFLKMAPPNDPFRDQAKSLISMIKDWH